MSEIEDSTQFISTITRQEVVRRANAWCPAKEYKPTPQQLSDFFTQAGCEVAPTLEQAAFALNSLANGVPIPPNGQITHWCGIFAIAILRRVGVQTKWNFGALPTGGGTKFIWRWHDPELKGIALGDVPVIPAQQHHFIIVHRDGDKLWTVEGNTAPGNKIRRRERTINDSGDQRIYGYHKIIA